MKLDEGVYTAQKRGVFQPVLMNRRTRTNSSLVHDRRQIPQARFKVRGAASTGGINICPSPHEVSALTRFRKRNDIWDP